MRVLQNHVQKFFIFRSSDVILIKQLNIHQVLIMVVWLVTPCSAGIHLQDCSVSQVRRS
jgi:hypothetical protein